MAIVVEINVRKGPFGDVYMYKWGLPDDRPLPKEKLVIDLDKWACVVWVSKRCCLTHGIGSETTCVCLCTWTYAIPLTPWIVFFFYPSPFPLTSIFSHINETPFFCLLAQTLTNIPPTNKNYVSHAYQKMS